MNKVMKLAAAFAMLAAPVGAMTAAEVSERITDRAALIFVAENTCGPASVKEFDSQQSALAVLIMSDTEMTLQMMGSAQVYYDLVTELGAKNGAKTLKPSRN